MLLYLKLAWRNIWRNKGRTLITVFAVFFAVVLAIYMRSQQMGSYELMIENTVASFSGYIQVHQKGFWEEQNLDNTFEEDEKAEKKIKSNPKVVEVIPRLESYALLASENQTRAGIIIGINPKKEEQLSNPEKRLLRGKYFENDAENAVLIAEGLAKYLKLGIGDSLVIIGQGFRGTSAVGKYLIKGILKYPTPDLNKSLVYMPLKTTQELFGAYARLTNWSIILKDSRNAEEVSQELASVLPQNIYEVMSWEEMMPELVQMIESDNVSGQIMIGVLYVLVSFGVLGTVIMMLMERRYEFGVLIGIGMARWKLGLVIMSEILMMAFLGVLLGSVLMFPVVLYFYYNPIPLTGELAKTVEEYGFEPVLRFAFNAELFYSQAIVIFIITSLIALYPLWKMQFLKVIEAMRH